MLKNIDLDSKNSEPEVVLGTVEYGCQRYQLGSTTFRKLCRENGTIIKVGRCWRFDVRKMDSVLLGERNN